MTKNFYSNVFLTGDKILYIGYDHGERVQYEEVFSPVLFAPTNNKTEYKTSPIDQAGKYKDHGFKNLHIVDLDGALTGKTVNFQRTH